jgi:hypothetical protein
MRVFVTPDIAETTTTMERCCEASAAIVAALRIREASPTDVPPNFITWIGRLIELSPLRGP